MDTAIARVRFDSFLQGLREWRGVIYAWAAVFSFVLIFARGLWMVNNILLWEALAIGILTWIGVGIVCVRDSHHIEDMNYDKRLAVKARWAKERLLPIRIGEVILVVLLASLFIGYPSAGRVWVVPSKNETSLSRSLFWTPPFFTPNFYAVGTSYDQTYIPIVAMTKDGVPISCMVSASGIKLDQRNTQKLERYLLGLAVTRDPELYLNSEMQAALANSASAVLSGKTGEEIGRQGKLLIPYKIGTPLGDVLARIMLHWSGGTVSFDCSLAKFQS